jgi:hypothetical protein
MIEEWEILNRAEAGKLFLEKARWSILFCFVFMVFERHTLDKNFR